MIGMLFDVTILGSDLSGLIAGALLVKRGYNVLIADVEAQAHVKKIGEYRLRRFPGMFFGFGKGQIFSEIFTELGIPFLDKKRFLMAEPGFQIVTPARRVDLPQSRDELFRTVSLEFPKESGKVVSLISDVDRYAQVIRGFFVNDVVYPPSTWGEGRAAKKALANVSDLYKEAIRTDYGEFVDRYELSPEARTFVDGQVQYLSPVYPDAPNLAYAANLLGLTNNGIFQVEGGIKVLETLYRERISAYRGVCHRTPAIEHIEFGKYTEIKFADQKEPIKTKAIAVCDNPEEFFKAWSPKHLKSDFKEKLELPPPGQHDFVLYVGIDANVVPVGMGPNVILVQDPRRELIDDNLIMISLSAPDDEALAPIGKRLLAARVKIRPQNGVMEERTADMLCERIHAALRELMPFLDDFTDFVAKKESYELYRIERAEAWSQNIDDDKLGVALLHNRTPHKSVFYTGKAVLPGLGMEGEAVSARNLVSIIAEEYPKK